MGMPPGRVESPSTGGALGDTDTHERLSVPPGSVQENDIYRAGPGDFRTVAQRIELHPSETLGEIALYFRTPHEGIGFRVILDAYGPEVTVYRPRLVTA